MFSSQLSLQQLAKEGDSTAITALLSQSLPEGTTAKVSLKENCLRIVLESAKIPDQQAYFDLVQQNIKSLNVVGIHQVKICGRELGEDYPDWQAEFEITPEPIPDVADLARQGNIEAINTLINQWINQPGIPARASLKNGCLRVMLEAFDFPDQIALGNHILDGVKRLEIQGCTKLKLIGQEPGDEFPDWQQDYDLPQEGELPIHNSVSSLEVPSKQNFWGSVFGAVSGAAGAVGEAVSGTVIGVAGAASNAAVQAGGAISETIAGAAGAVGGAVSGTVVGAAGAASNAAVQAGGAITSTAVNVAGAVGGAAMQATDSAGYILDVISNSPQLQEVTKALQVDKFICLIDTVDVVKAETHVRRLQQKYPNEKPGDISHRVMSEKALYVGSSGFASSLMPGFAAAMFAVDLAATMALQAEMIYQIACAYGLSLREPARKGEVLAIFGMALGGNSAVKAGLGLARNIPFAGAVIGASGNAALLYGLGYAACRFYEAKLNPGDTSDLVASQEKSEEYLQDAIEQQIIMDQILIHIVLAGTPGKKLKQILPELKALNLSPASLNIITKKPDTLPSLEKLLEQLNHDFAVSLIAQCKKIAQADGTITIKEAKIISTIAQKFSFDLDLI
ncbi:MAG TPA: hypothetical protein V6D10_01555 [Trichocoleus sp.]|jgi:uncharacterized protein (DUF697 family)